MWMPKPTNYFLATAQKEWRILQERKAKARQEQLEQEAKIRKEYEAKQEAIRLKKEQEKRLQEEEIKRHEELQRQIDDYIDNGTKTPEALRAVTESQPGKELCPFFTKTAACRYGDTCSRNHRRVCLSKVILIPGFYSHFSLEKNSAEYDTDVVLEFESSETRQHFREFYKDVVPELESFGRIKTLKYCCNTEIHLRGNLYVEYYTEREAARAVRKLKGRWYAGRQLNCEFANLKSWRNAVCGMVKCPKGRACNFLHTFRNPHDEYDIRSPPRWAKRTESQDPTTRRSEHRSNRSKWEESTRGGNEEDRDWRWSESPEVEVEHRRKNGRHRRQEDIDGRYNSRRDRRQEETERAGRNSRNLETHDRRSPGGRSSRRRDNRSKRKHSEDSDNNEELSSHTESQGRHSKVGKRSRDPRSGIQKGSRTREKTRNDSRFKSKDVVKRTNDEENDSPQTKSLIANKEPGGSKDYKTRKHSKRVKRPKSKWDDVESNNSYSENESDYTDSSTNDHKEHGSPVRYQKRSSTESNDGWETSDSETNKQKRK
ncbi:U2 small nuclear ribonucleoprotein auxiliary factor 35 kDa subunit-related protein 1 isoform X3 [Cephus cinctus]|uniref:U2 small nuclear ribonucleoprotein auxiliary factor 35 kDa subunit-related protein 1 isoform X3 n=1 Tax=Cephus cinctus TaxID=211228 RepID=A0AAJ7RUV4_CEPCN|nr:U2 small nuclear ribonucleoprotein auxiliary factor 35 kDa subunit-related protein 1 isoform X3 [Cephus cinctus]